MNAHTDLIRYIAIWSPSLLIGLVIAVVGAAAFFTGFTRKRDGKFIVAFSVIMFLLGAFMCVGLIPEEIFFAGYIEKQYYILLNTLRMQIFTFGGIILLVYSLLFGFTKKLQNIYSDTVLKITSVITGMTTGLLALALIGFGINGFINYVNV